MALDQGETDASFEEPELHLIVNKGSKTILFPEKEMEPIKISGRISVSF
ncbi:MAG: hypothetical protein ACK4HV_01060 [Parachlamydiaceae bacterium]